LAVGVAVGLAVGVAVGLAVGVAVGFTVGVAVGFGVGVAVGETSGDADAPDDVDGFPLSGASGSVVDPPLQPAMATAVAKIAKRK